MHVQPAPAFFCSDVDWSLQNTPNAIAACSRRLETAGTELDLEVFAGPFVRSSYRAEEAYLKVIGQG